MESPAESNSKYLSADERRAVTVEAVVALAADRNPAEITTAAIAAHMGLTQGAIFRHFPTKDSIVQAVLDWVSERLLSRVDGAAHTQASPLKAMEAVFLAHVGFVAEHPGAPRMLLAELQKAGDTVPKRMVTTLIGSYRERLLWLLDRGKETGEVDPGLDIDAAATLYIGMIQGLVMQSLASGEPARLLREAPPVFDIYLRGVARVR